MPLSRAVSLRSTSSTNRHTAIRLRKMILIELSARVNLALWGHNTPINHPVCSRSPANSGESPRHLTAPAPLFSPPYAYSRPADSRTRFPWSNPYDRSPSESALNLNHPCYCLFRCFRISCKEPGLSLTVRRSRCFQLDFDRHGATDRWSLRSFSLAATPTTASIDYQPRPRRKPARVGLLDDRYEPEGLCLPASHLGRCRSSVLVGLTVHHGQHLSRQRLALTAEPRHARDRRRCRRGVDNRQTGRDLCQGGKIHSPLGRSLGRPLDAPATITRTLNRHVPTIGIGRSPVDFPCSSGTKRAMNGVGLAVRWTFRRRTAGPIKRSDGLRWRRKALCIF